MRRRRTRTLPSRLLKGAPLLGFATVFEATKGDPETPFPYPVVTPSTVGPVLLPFACPHCDGDCGAVVDPDRRLEYYDAERKFSWCPKCQKRFFVDRKGKPLTAALPAGVTLAPAEIYRPETDDTVTSKITSSRPEGALHLLGAVSSV